MINLQDLLATNMRRFGTKNLNEGTIDPQLKQVFDQAELKGLEQFLPSQVNLTIGQVVGYAGTKHYFVCTRIKSSETTIAALEPEFQCTPYYVGTRYYQIPMAKLPFPDLIERYVSIYYNSKPRSGELNLYVARAGSTPDLSPTPKVYPVEVKGVADIALTISQNFNLMGTGGVNWAAKQATAGPAAATFSTTMTKLKHPQMALELNMVTTAVAAVKKGGGAAAAYYNALPAQTLATVQKTAVPVKKP